MATVTPVKTVTFRLPSDSPQTRSGTNTPERPRATPPPNPTPDKTHPIVVSEATHTPTSSISPQLAEIVSRAKSVHSNKLAGKWQPNPRGFEHHKQIRADRRPRTEVQTVLKQEVASQVVTRDRSPLVERQTYSRIRPSHVTQIASQVRERSSISCHSHVRLLKYEVAKLREHLLKVEEEIKHLNRGRHTLELAIQDVRKALSMNQQSLSTQKKKSRGDQDGCLHLLSEEAQVLLKVKREAEHHLQIVKTHLQQLDATRKTLKAKVNSFSHSLELDAQNFKLYDGPLAVRSDAVSRQRQYASGYPVPKTRTEDEAAVHLCSKAVEVISASRAARGEIKALVVSIQGQKTEAHEKITSAITRHIQETRAEKRDILLEQGQVRVAHNSTNHQKHSEEIALGMAMGPISEKHRSVSEKMDRPLSRLRPNSAVEERACLKETTTRLARQLSATSVRASQMSESDQRLSRQLKEKSQTTLLDSQTLRIRKISLDNRWVQ